MALIPFPNVPNVPGVPAIPRLQLANSDSTLTLILGFLQTALWNAFQVNSQWGIFDSRGNALGNPSQFTGITGSLLNTAGIGPKLSTNAVEYSKETRVSDFPIETGSFASYNKVELPAEPRVTLCLTGSESDRTFFLNAIDAACKSTDLYSVVTPEVTYINYSIERYNYSRRSSKGTTLLMVELVLREIRQVSAAFAQSNNPLIDQPKDTGATAQIDVGKVQPQTPKQSTLKSIINNLPALANRASALLTGG